MPRDQHRRPQLFFFWKRFIGGKSIAVQINTKSYWKKKKKTETVRDVVGGDKHNLRESANCKAQINTMCRVNYTDLCVAICRFSQVVFVTSNNIPQNLLFYFQLLLVLIEIWIELWTRTFGAQRKTATQVDVQVIAFVGKKVRQTTGPFPTFDLIDKKMVLFRWTNNSQRSNPVSSPKQNIALGCSSHSGTTQLKALMSVCYR